MLGCIRTCQTIPDNLAGQINPADWTASGASLAGAGQPQTHDLRPRPRESQHRAMVDPLVHHEHRGYFLISGSPSSLTEGATTTRRRTAQSLGQTQITGRICAPSMAVPSLSSTGCARPLLVS